MLQGNSKLKSESFTTLDIPKDLFFIVQGLLIQSSRVITEISSFQVLTLPQMFLILEVYKYNHIVVNCYKSQSGRQL